MRFDIYNTTYSKIPIGAWMMIKEPMYKLANDGMNIIAIDNPDDVEFLD